MIQLPQDPLKGALWVMGIITIFAPIMFIVGYIVYTVMKNDQEK